MDITSAMQLSYEKADGFTWLTHKNESVQAWYLACTGSEEEKAAFKRALLLAASEAGNKETVDLGMAEDELNYRFGLYEEDPESKSESDDPEELGFDRLRISRPTQYDSDSDAEEQDRARSPVGQKNRNLTVGTAINRVFLTRGSKIGVFTDEDNTMKLLSTIPDLKSAKGEAVVPSEMILHNRDNEALMLDEARPEVVFSMDLNVGKIVSEFKVNKDADFKIRSINPSAKYAQRTGTDTFMASGSQFTALMDKRSREGGAIVQQYAKAPGFSGIATTGSGQIVCGSEKGELYLYSRAGQKAKVNLPGLGNAIIGVDVTEQGDYVLATTAKYLFLVCTKVPDESGKTGFDKVFGKGNKPKPIKLALKHADIVKYGLYDLHFTRAYFNTGEGIREKYIVSSTGKYIITWNMDRIKAGHVQNSYQLKKMANDVMGNQFIYAQEDKVVAAQADNILLERRQKH